jgi:hypothetical protein
VTLRKISAERAFDYKRLVLGILVGHALHDILSMACLTLCYCHRLPKGPRSNQTAATLTPNVSRNLNVDVKNAIQT